MGHPRLIDSGGTRVEMTSKKSIAVLGLLALASDGIRSRAWLQQKLWGSRDAKQAQNSLRRELSNMRRSLPCVPLVADNRAVRLDLAAIWIDAVHGNGAAGAGDEDFLEGLDIAGEEDFEEWLRDARSQIAAGPIAAGQNTAGGRLGNGSAADEDSPEWGSSGQPQPDRGAADGSAFFASPADPGDCQPPAIEIATDRAAGALTSEAAALLRLVTQELAGSLARLGTLQVSTAHDGRDGAEGSAGIAATPIRPEPGRHMLQVSLVPVGNAPLLAAACLEYRSRAVLWSETVALPAPLQMNDLTLRIGRIANCVEGAVLATGRLPGDAAVHDLDLMRSLAMQRFLMRRIRSASDNSLAEKLQRRIESIHSDPETEIYRAMIALRAFWWKPQRGSLRDIRHLGEQALARNPGDARPLMVLAILETWSGNFGVATHLLERAIAANPAGASAYANLGSVYLLRGDSQKAVQMLRTADALSPFDPELFWIHGQLATAAFIEGDLDEALRQAGNALSLHSRYCLPALIALNCHLQKGDAVMARRFSHHPAFARPAVLNHVLALMPFEDPSHTRRLRAGVETAAAQHA